MMPRFLRRRPCACLAKLGDCRAQLQVSERARTRLKAQLDHYIGQAIRAREERDRAETTLRAMEEDRHRIHGRLADSTARERWLVGSVRDLEDRIEQARGVTDRLRTELQELRAGLAVGALKRKGTR